MKKDYLELGQIVGTHGVRGEMRVNPRCDGPDFAKGFGRLFFDPKGINEVKVISARPHGNIILMKLEGIDSIEKAEKLRNRILYLKREDAHLPEGTWFIAELLDCEVLDADTGERYGVLTDVSETGANDVWYITADDGKEYLIPAIKDVVIRAEAENNRIYIRPLKGLLDDAD